MTRRLVGTVAIVVLCAACGKSPEEKQAEAIAKGAEQMAKGMAGAATQKPVNPVAFEALMPLLPELAGWVRESPQGERITSIASVSTATTTYRKGDATIDAKITDTGMNQMFFAPFVVLMTSGYSHETTDGWEKATKFGENPGLEKWEKSTKTGTLDVIVGRRFLIEYEGRNVDDIRPVRELVERTDLKTLAALK